ncbi:MAG: cation-transporting ATPase [Candidatus Nealsonbacteria bacterium CG08_land_8_20_14_0_20_38_20]|uniref:Cation-transporting ATPase n=1 Tax=Candidatus Nealsonbacteria bacterium CG08_land_8_20_14_0_20_38_20 TaxID=1974705 RepID=A0A2H0YLC2_9BACT|nr:MAG: cation-transporting ATPase [Candidatus Nealsonbacteria bacterium CG08_land_8_20_14_0_20_38_20]
MKFSKYTTKNIEEVFNDLKSREDGLSENEAASRLKTYGLNEARTEGLKPINIILRQFKTSFVYLLFIAALIAFLIGEKIDGAAILFFVFVNVFLGFFQEFRAEKAVLLLKKYFPSRIKVVRSGIEKIIDKKFLVPGDIVLLEAGNVIPADLRLIKSDNFLVDETVLTGESAPVSKTSQPLVKVSQEIFEAENVVFGGTSVVSGEAKGIVVGTAKEMVFGEIAKLVSGIARESVYEKELSMFSQIILRIVLITISFIFLVNLIIKGPQSFFDFLIFSIALVVSVLPEALPTVVTFAFSRGALKLARKKVVVKRLSAVNDLGNIEILCADKTGTLTENKLVLEEIFAEDKEKCLLYSLLSSSSNPFDFALLGNASKKILGAIKNFRKISEITFDSFRMRNSVLLEDKQGDKILIVKGAPEIILKLSTVFGGFVRETLLREIEKEGREGKRTLGIAFKKFSKDTYSKEDENGLIFLGYFSFRDHLKKTAGYAIQIARKLGVQIKIITGDSKEVAGNVGKEIGLIDDEQKVILGETIESFSEKEFFNACLKFSVFARVSPTTKYKIVKALSEKYEVGFLGEGINDAPALKAAHLAITVDTASDVSREVSDIILLKKDLKVIIGGIREGRNIFSNINKYIKCTLSSNFGNFYSIALISLFLPFLPMLPSQILLVNLLSDFPLIAVASDKVDIEELKKPKLYQLNKIIMLIFLLALVSAVFDFAFFGIFRQVQPSLLQTLWFILSILTEIFLIFSIRSRKFFLNAKIPSLPLISISLLTLLVTISLPFSSFGQETLHFVPPSLFSLLIVFFLIISYFSVSEMVKLIYFHYWKPEVNHFKNTDLTGKQNLVK